MLASALSVTGAPESRSARALASTVVPSMSLSLPLVRFGRRCAVKTAAALRCTAAAGADAR